MGFFICIFVLIKSPFFLGEANVKVLPLPPVVVAPIVLESTVPHGLPKCYARLVETVLYRRSLYLGTSQRVPWRLAGGQGGRVASPCHRGIMFGHCFVVVPTLPHRYNAVRGHRTGPDNSGAGDYLRRKTNKEQKITPWWWPHVVLLPLLPLLLVVLLPPLPVVCGLPLSVAVLLLILFDVTNIHYVVVRATLPERGQHSGQKKKVRGTTPGRGRYNSGRK